jgi:hypothetical protein
MPWLVPVMTTTFPFWERAADRGSMPGYLSRYVVLVNWVEVTKKSTGKVERSIVVCERRGGKLIVVGQTMEEIRLYILSSMAARHVPL